MSNTSFYDRWGQFSEATIRVQAIEQIPRALEFAEYSVLSVDELILRLQRLEDDPAPSRVIDFLVKHVWSPSTQRAIASIARDYALRCANLTPKKRAVLERACLRLLFRLPISLTRNLLRECITSNRTILRQAAYRAYTTHGLDVTMTDEVRQHFISKGRQEPLVLIARNPEAVPIVGHQWLLEHLDERYWRMRVLRSVMASETLDIESLAREYPLEFLWAVGKEQDPGWLPLVRDLLQMNQNSPEFVRWAIWVFGLLGARSDLTEIRLLAEAFIEELLRFINEAQDALHVPYSVG